MKALLIMLCVVLIASAAYWLDVRAHTLPSYEGLPTVSCIDPTLVIKQKYTFKLLINIDGQNKLLDSNIGHDYASCLRSIYTNDASGVVIVKSNSNDKYTLENFFNVWKKTFNRDQIFNFQADNGHHLVVVKNGRSVDTFEKTLVESGDQIQIFYK